MQIKDSLKHRAYLGEVGADLKTTLQKGLGFINWDRHVNKDSRIFVKPNFTFPEYREGVTTSPQFLECLLEVLKTRAGKVIVGESDGGNHSFKAEESFEGHNVYRMCERLGVEVVNLSTLPAETVESEVAGKTVKVQLPRMLLEETDCFISVPVLKVHVMTTVSISLKNSWGCVPDTMRCLHHQNLSHKLALIASLLKPKLIVVDGTYALDKHGPMYGEPVKTGLVLMSDNTVAVDAIGARLMGFSPEKIRHLTVAQRAGLGSLNPGDVELNTQGLLVWRDRG